MTVPAATAADELTDEAGPGELVAAYNEHVGQLPWFVEEYVPGERVELVVPDADGDTSNYHGTVASDGRITDYEAERSDDPTVRVTTDVSMLEPVGGGSSYHYGHCCLP